MVINENSVSVKMYKGEEVCRECGRHIRNVVEIDGVTYGVRCCEKHLPHTHRVNHKTHQVETIVSPMEIARQSFGDEQQVFKAFWSQSVESLQAFLAARTPDHFRYAAVSEVLRVKLLCKG